ncbi:MarR family transcriptional regulator [Leptospira sp. 2 VSF19]|uniref:MarR family transcriptional regulator n=1 Tax=Leptospira soteropolitanensis TaxID=2950025 RepID=A0AAW5VTM4_9LEPT|nr:MarR family transcriptional regulator [Leptospira soteropolitanensis]MCW7494475.1 MarR family transcriptional regulator [Leptospira soteropolitanensis]MCW7502069.1 MarR family transcriptional regulator [Leptospira soteropolitanensis]MCW7524321.1 MarR family transcriptional regulator [Leptospira soteropolitanensis]MCW7528186.1 MarR family transcriptional regulator [Leptospira soteropolitanensis]MCW7532039.1 MarR family transcriptional regulator [Leptospira soteropolitanensis]
MEGKGIASFLGIYMSETMLLMRRFLSDEFIKQRIGMRFEDWMLLLPLVESESSNQKELSERLVKDKTTVSRLVDGWVKKSWVKRVVSDTDKRHYHLRFTKKGKEIWEKGIPIVQSADQVFRKDLSEKEEKELYLLLFKIQSSVQFANLENK